MPSKYQRAQCMMCRQCNLDKNTIGINKKLIDDAADNFYCLGCLAIYLDVSEEDIMDKIDDFKHQGCAYFE